jgi:hypothetical protein
MSQPTRFDVRATTISSIAKESIGTMIGLVLVTHGRLAVEFVSALEHVVGPQRNVGAVCIGPEDDMEMRRNEILDAVARCDTGAGVVARRRTSPFRSWIARVSRSLRASICRC